MRLLLIIDLSFFLLTIQSIGTHGFVASRRALAKRESSIHPSHHVLSAKQKQTDEEIIEESRLKILTARRNDIRRTLKAAEALKTVRIRDGYATNDADDDEKKANNNSKLAVTITATVVAVGAVALRVGGRAALVSATGLDFLTQSPEIRDQLQTILATADTMALTPKLLAFCAAWTAVKVFCFDAGGVVLALASGILFGGVLQGALLSATAATLGSSVAFALAQADTPVRTKALELLEEYPSLRGIEKVVARDGLKAVLTLRLAPVLPIPIGMYNYVYGVTNVPVTDFLGGIFLGSLKPYLLDSYLGFFGKEVIEQSAAGAESATGAGYQDFLLLGALGVSVLIGVFASQLASETWDSVLEEIEEEKKNAAEETEEETDDGVVREVFGWNLPQWVVGFQLQLKAANSRIDGLVIEEFQAGVWNYTIEEVPKELNPAELPTSAEKTEVGSGVDFGASFCDGIVLSPLLFGAFLRYSDPSIDQAILGNQTTSESCTDSKTFEDRLEMLRDLESETQHTIEKLKRQLREQGSAS